MTIGNRRIGLTGASSGVGRAILDAFKNSGFEVVSIPRDPNAVECVDLTEGTVRLQDYGTILHLAWNRRDRTHPEISRNVSGSLKLLETCAVTHTRVIFLSSISAERKDSRYGSQKRHVEETVLARGGTVIRCGFISGTTDSGIMGLLRRLANVPGFCLHLHPDPEVEVTSEVALITTIKKVINGEVSDKRIRLVNRKSQTLSALVHAMSDSSRRKLHLPIPVSVVRKSLRRASSLSKQASFFADSLEGVAGKIVSGEPQGEWLHLYCEDAL
jgi:hypothetical protein